MILATVFKGAWDKTKKRHDIMPMPIVPRDKRKSNSHPRQTPSPSYFRPARISEPQVMVCSATFFPHSEKRAEGVGKKGWEQRKSTEYLYRQLDTWPLGVFVSLHTSWWKQRLYDIFCISAQFVCFALCSWNVSRYRAALFIFRAMMLPHQSSELIHLISSKDTASKDSMRQPKNWVLRHAQKPHPSNKSYVLFNIGIWKRG